jgi:hypothetical protein
MFFFIKKIRSDAFYKKQETAAQCVVVSCFEIENQPSLFISMINSLKTLFHNAMEPIREIRGVIRPRLHDSALKSDSEQITSPNGSPKYYKGLLQLQELNKGLNIDDPYDLLSENDRRILLNLHALERKYCRFQPLGTHTREKVLDILSEVDPIIQKADTEFGVLVINERVLLLGCGQRDEVSSSDSCLIRQSFYPEIMKNSFFAVTHNHPNVFLQESSSYVSAPSSLQDLTSFSKPHINLHRAVDYGGAVYTVESSPNTKKGLLADYLSHLTEDISMDKELISDMQKLMKVSGNLPPELRSSRDRVLEYLKGFEKALPEMAQQFGFTYRKTFLNQDDK